VEKQKIMAIIRDNIVTEGMSGMFGDMLVFKHLRGKTIVCKRPSRPRRQSVRQQENRNKFREASSWAKAVLLNPEKKEYYQKKARRLKLPNAYTAAIADYMRTPSVKQVNAYGDTVTYKVVKKDFALTKVEVTVRKSSSVREVRTTAHDEPAFRLHRDEVNSGVVIRAIDVSGRVTELAIPRLAA
jgi:hypothetical protein